ncbi:MAG: flagellar biosynthetic protein FliR [Tissierellia bacterium]|nr:flagellar biosynthetic protein FliR [Tissierellia bacterium]
MTFTGDFTYFLLIFARMSGFVFFNQIFGRGNLPNYFKISLSLLFAITVYGILPPDKDMAIVNSIVYALLIIKELFIGYLTGYIISAFFSTVVISGEIIGIQIGMAMSKIYDPNSNVSMGIIGSFLNLILILVFFSSKGHLNLIQIFIVSNKLIEVGKFSIPNQLFYNMVELFQQVLILALKLSMPIMAVEIILESGIGILMKAIPQIQVFSVNIQLKIMIGLVMLLILVPTFATFIENVIVLMFDNIESSLSALIT